MYTSQLAKSGYKQIRGGEQGGIDLSISDSLAPMPRALPPPILTTEFVHVSLSHMIDFE